MKKKYKAMLIPALIIMLAAAPWTVWAGEDAGEVSESLAAATTNYDSDRDPVSDLYYAYNLDGELMFEVLEYSYDYIYMNDYDIPLDYYIPLIKFYTEKEIISYPSSSDGLCVVESRIDAETEKLKSRTGYYVNYDNGLAEIEKESYDEPAYTEDGYIIDETKYVLDENGRTSEVLILENGNWVRYGVFSYDEYGNLTAAEYYDTETGELDSTYTDQYQYNDYGQPTRTKTIDPDGDETESITDYITMQDIESAKANYPFVGYWTGEENGKTTILGISVNGFLFEGYVDEETELVIPENYARYTLNEDGTLDCEYYEYGIKGGDEWSAVLKPEVSGDKLIFDGKEYTRSH